MPDDPQPKTIPDTLKEFILSNGLRPGDRLPSQRDLAERLRCGRSAVRDALKALDAQGWVSIVPRAGTFVRIPSSEAFAKGFGESLQRDLREHASTLFQLVQARMLIEVEVAGLAATHATEDDLLNMRLALVRMKEALSDREAYVGVDGEFHRAMTLAAKNEILVTMLDAVTDVLYKARQRLNPNRKVMQTSYKQHQAIYDAIRYKRPQGARAAMREHLRYGKKVLCKSLGIPMGEGAFGPHEPGNGGRELQ